MDKADKAANDAAAVIEKAQRKYARVLHQDPKPKPDDPEYSWYKHSEAFLQGLIVVGYAVWAVYGWLQVNPLVWHFPVSIVLGLLVSDLFSGLLHWAMDTYGTDMTILFGQNIHDFREHHEHPRLICQHTFGERSGHIFMITTVALLASWAAGTGQFFNNSWWCIMLGVMHTNEFHMWSHQGMSENPVVVRLLMGLGLILTNDRHKLHHRGMHDTDYCITTGLLNPFLETIQFWHRFEWAIWKVSGAAPREYLTEDCAEFRVSKGVSSRGAVERLEPLLVALKKAGAAAAN
jgi:ubiquitin-conjugating enzyme E2 variant